MNPKVDQFLRETPEWREETKKLRAITLRLLMACGPYSSPEPVEGLMACVRRPGVPGIPVG